MPKYLIPFDSGRHHIYLEFEVIDNNGITRYGFGILDTGAPRTEFSDAFLNYIGMLDLYQSEIEIPASQETKKYRKIVLPSVTICGYRFNDAEFMVSRFDKSWGIHALIGLDLFRQSRITIDYQNSQIICEPF